MRGYGDTRVCVCACAQVGARRGCGYAIAACLKHCLGEAEAEMFEGRLPT